MFYLFTFFFRLRKCISENKTISSQMIKGMYEELNTRGYFSLNIDPSSQSDMENCFAEFDEAKTADEKRVVGIFNTISTDPNDQQNDEHRFIMKMAEGEFPSCDKVLGPAKDIVKRIMKAYGDFTGVRFQDSQDWVSLVSEPYGQIQSLHTDWSSSINNMKLMAEFVAKEKVVPLSCIYFAQKGAFAINQANLYDTMSMYELDWVDGVKPLASEAIRSLRKGQTKGEILKTNGKLDPSKKVRIGTTRRGCQVKFKFCKKIFFNVLIFPFFNFFKKYFCKKLANKFSCRNYCFFPFDIGSLWSCLRGTFLSLFHLYRHHK